MYVGIHEAKTKLSKLIPAALAGTEVIITKSGQPLVKLVPVRQENKERPMGLYRDTVKILCDPSEPLPETEIESFWPTKL